MGHTLRKAISNFKNSSFDEFRKESAKVYEITKFQQLEALATYLTEMFGRLCLVGITHHKTSLNMSTRVKKRESPVIEANPFDKIGLTCTGHSS